MHILEGQGACQPPGTYYTLFQFVLSKMPETSFIILVDPQEANLLAPGPASSGRSMFQTLMVLSPECYRSHLQSKRLWGQLVQASAQLGMCGDEELTPVLCSFWSYIQTNIYWALSLQLLCWGRGSQGWTKDVVPALTVGAHSVHG